MSKVLTHAIIYTGNPNEPVIKDGFIRFDQKIQALGPMVDFAPVADDEIVPVPQKIIVPGFIDVHTHGAYGFDTMDGTAQDILKMVKGQLTEGITTVFPTTMTQSIEKIDQAMVAINTAAQQEPAIQGVHLEGPFVNPHYKGAQPEQYMIAPSIELVQKWDELSGNRVRLITYAPERAENLAEFEDYLIEHQIVGSIGHSDATRAFLQTQVKANRVTHLYNAQRPMHHREAGVTGHAMLEQQLNGELIVDGFHVVPDMVNLAYQVKSAEHIDLVTDSMRAKGLGDGESELGGQKVWVKAKQARLENGALAGSVLEFDDAFRNMIKFTGASIQEAVQMASVNQAKEFNLTQKGSLAVGKDADLNIFTHDLSQLTDTYSVGRHFSKVNRP